MLVQDTGVGAVTSRMTGTVFLSGAPLAYVCCRKVSGVHVGSIAHSRLSSNQTKVRKLRSYGTVKHARPSHTIFYTCS